MTANLHTVRDFFRFAVTEFTCADLQFGHGAINAVDEAAFIVLEALSLPIDDINPWLDARLTGAERARLIDLIEQRVATRKPAAYLLGKAYVQGVPFFVDERVIVPRSFIGEILGEASGALPQTAAAILDLCAGSACLAILAARVFPHAQIDAVELSADALDVARAPNRHLAFGAGPHQCVGMNVARLEGRIAIGRFLARFPEFALSAPPTRGGRARFRGFSAIPATLA